MHQVMASSTLSGQKRYKTILDGSESTIFQYHLKRSFIYLLVPVVSLGNVRLCIVCIGTIAEWKSTESYITLCLITGITFHYFPLL